MARYVMNIVDQLCLLARPYSSGNRKTRRSVNVGLFVYPIRHICKVTHHGQQRRGQRTSRPCCASLRGPMLLLYLVCICDCQLCINL